MRVARPDSVEGRPRTRLTTAVVALALAASLAACTETDAPREPPAATTSPTAPAPEEKPLQVGVYGDRRKVIAYRDIVEAFQATQPDVEVELTSYPDAATAADELRRGLSDGSAPDVFLADYRHFPALLATQGLQPVDTMLEEHGLGFGDDFQRVGLTSFSANARLQCMPAEVSPLVVYYNRGLVHRAQPAEPVVLPEAEGATWEWSDFEALARAVAGIDRTGPVRGAWFPSDVETLTAFVRSAGSDVVDDVLEPTSLNLTSDEALEVVGALASLARDSEAFATGAERPEAVELFARGRLGLLMGTREDVPRLRAAERLRFDVLPLPTFGRVRSVSYMNGWCVSSSTERAAAAAELIAFAVGPEASAIAARSGSIVPSGLDTVHDRSFTQPRQQPASAYVYPSAIRRSEPMPFAVAWPAVAREVESVLARLYTTPGVDLERTLAPRLERLNERSVALFGGPVE